MAHAQALICRIFNNLRSTLESVKSPHRTNNRIGITRRTDAALTIINTRINTPSVCTVQIQKNRTIRYIGDNRIAGTDFVFIIKIRIVELILVFAHVKIIVSDRRIWFCRIVRIQSRLPSQRHLRGGCVIQFPDAGRSIGGGRRMGGSGNHRIRQVSAVHDIEFVNPDTTNVGLVAATLTAPQKPIQRIRHGNTESKRINRSAGDGQSIGLGRRIGAVLM